MQINVSNIEKLNEQEIFESIKNLVDKIYKSFEYLSIENDEYYDYVLTEIRSSKTKYKGDVSYLDYMKKRLKIYFMQQLQNILAEPKKDKIVITNYINKFFKNIADAEESIKKIKKFDFLLDSCNYTITPDIILDLISNNKAFNYAIALIFSKYKNEIIDDTFEENCNNYFIILSIETYCTLNSIETAKKIDDVDIDIKIESEDNDDDIDDLNNHKGKKESAEYIVDTVKSYLNEIRNYKVLSVEEERELAVKIANGDIEARKKFTEHNLRLVVSIAKRYIGRGLTFNDLIQEGNLGLLKAIDRFDFTKDFKFSTYATWWIRQAITRAIGDKGRNIRIPIHLHEKIGAYNKVVSELENRLNREPTINEIANEMRISISAATKLSKWKEDTISINTQIGDDGDSELVDFVVSDLDSPEDIVLDLGMSNELNELFNKIDFKPREKKVLLLRFGFVTGKPLTLEVIAKMYNVTRERIRQIEGKGLMKLRNSRYTAAFSVYMQNPNQALENLENYRRNYRENNGKITGYVRQYKKEEEDTMGKLQTIYEYFNDYTKEQIDEMIESLSDEDKELLHIRYGPDFEKPTKTKMTKEENAKFYGSLVPKMRRLLAKANNGKSCKPRKQYERKIRKENTTKNTIVEIPKKEVIIQPKATTIETKVVEPEIDKKQLANIEVKENESTNNTLTKIDYQRILELLKTPSFSEMINKLSVKEAIIISLKLGYVDNKYFSTESIANFLGIEEDEVIETTKKILLLYKESINGFIDTAIKVITDTKGHEKTLI